MNDLTLRGCRSIPLASYLKALGVLRLVAEQADPQARGWWESGSFRLKTSLDRDCLTRFFLHDYCPTPVIAPWNGGSGFYPKDAKFGISAIQGSTSSRLDKFRAAIGIGIRLLSERKLQERPTDQAKGELVAALRAEGDADLVGWIDAAIALTLDGMAFPPLLGTGGNDGRLDFTNNFMQRVVELVPPDGNQPAASSDSELQDALFARPVAGLSSTAIGQFAPGAAGGPNSTAGVQGDSLVNRWDFVLMIEGALAFAGGVSRRLEGASTAYLSYPFTVRAAAAGFGSASLDEQGDTRGELWAPLWERPARYAEVRALFREGRLSLGTRPARDGLDAARAVNALGFERGIAGFERYGFVKRQGLAYLAVPLGRRRTEPNSQGDLLSELDRHRWLDRLRSMSAADNAPAELRQAVRTLEDGIFSLLSLRLIGQAGNQQVVQDLLVAFGAAARVVAIRPKLQEALRPPPQLSSRWLKAADDGSPEFRIAAALAGLRARLRTDEGGDATVESASGRAREISGLLMRAHLGPLGIGSRTLQWDVEKGGALVVWGAGRLTDNLCAVAKRRLLEQSRRGLSDVPFESSFDMEEHAPIAVDSGEIVAFLDGGVQYERIAGLLLGLAWVQPGTCGGARQECPLPFTYAALKPLFTPRSALDWLGKSPLWSGEIPDLPMPPALPSLLADGRIQDAVRLAQERARASGMPAPFLKAYATRMQSRAPDPDFGRRLLAALIIPTRVNIIKACLGQAYPPSDQESQNAA